MALKGLKVLEFAGLAPGPFCGMVLADFGASVIRINKINDNTAIDCLGNGKRSIALDLKQPESIKIIKTLCKTSDILLEPFRAGVMERLGLGPNVLMKDNPKLIYARLTGFGQNGYYNQRAGHDINYVGLSGLLSLFGRKGEKPIFPINLAADFGGGGLMCSLGILLALYHRSISGKGQIVDANMVEGTAYLGSWLYRSQKKLPIWGKERGENILDSGAHFYDVYETKDGKYMSVGAIEPQFYKNLLKGLAVKSEMNQYDFENGKKVFTEIFLTKTQAEWCEIFDTSDACVFPVLDIDLKLIDHKHNKEQKSFFLDEDGTVIPKPAPRLSETPGKSVALIPNVESGADTEQILKEAGYTLEEIYEFDRKGVVQLVKAKL